MKTPYSEPNQLTHRRGENTLLSGYVILFCDSDRNAHYGSHVWTLQTDLPEVSGELVAFAAEFYGISKEDARLEVNPSDIVDSARAWDDHQFVSDLWQAMERGDIKMAAGYRTDDGAVVINLEEVALRYSHED
jgi:hypothetical protein